MPHRPADQVRRRPAHCSSNAFLEGDPAMHEAFRPTALKVLLGLLVVFNFTTIAGTSPSETRTVTLKNGKTFEVETKRGMPLPYSSREIKMLILDANAAIPVLSCGKEGQEVKIPWLWALIAELKEKGSFTVTVTTPLDENISTTFEANGPGKISQTFFAKSDHPTIWEGIEDPGIHWFPFHFSFEEKTSKKRFEFTQWTQLDSKTQEQLRTMIQKMMREHCTKP